MKMLSFRRLPATPASCLLCHALCPPSTAAGLCGGCLRDLQQLAVRAEDVCPRCAGVSSGASDAVSSFAARCGVDVPHCRHVSALAASLFVQLADTLQLDPSDRRLLEAAAVLQDVGYLINYEDPYGAGRIQMIW